MAYLNTVVRNPEKLQRLRRSLNYEFLWSRTTEGTDYWREVAQNLTSLAKNIPFCASETSFSLLPQDLDDALIWKSTPQGHKYWAEVYLRLRELAVDQRARVGPPLDLRSLEPLLRDGLTTAQAQLVIADYIAPKVRPVPSKIWLRRQGPLAPRQFPHGDILVKAVKWL